MFWAKKSYCFSESVGNAPTMLLTDSCFNAPRPITLTAFPMDVKDVVSTVTFETTFRNKRVLGGIDFVRFNGTEYAVGTVGE